MISLITGCLSYVSILSSTAAINFSWWLATLTQWQEIFVSVGVRQRKWTFALPPSILRMNRCLAFNKKQATSITWHLNLLIKITNLFKLQSAQIWQVVFSWSEWQAAFEINLKAFDVAEWMWCWHFQIRHIIRDASSEMTWRKITQRVYYWILIHIRGIL